MKKKKKRINKKDLIFNITGIIIIIYIFLVAIFEETADLSIPKNDFIEEILAIVMIVVLLLWLFCYFKFGEDKNYWPSNKLKHANKYKFNFENFSEFNKFVKQKLETMGYDIYKDYELCENGKMYVYVKKGEKKKINIWVVVDVYEFTKRKWDKMWECLEDFYQITFGQEYKHLDTGIVVLCVKRFSDTLEDFLKETYFDGAGNLSVGILLNKKEICIPNCTEIGAMPFNYDAITEEFFKVVPKEPLQKNNKKKK